MAIHNAVVAPRYRPNSPISPPPPPLSLALVRVRVTAGVGPRATGPVCSRRAMKLERRVGGDVPYASLPTQIEAPATAPLTPRRQNSAYGHATSRRCFPPRVTVAPDLLSGARQAFLGVGAFAVGAGHHSPPGAHVSCLGGMIWLGMSCFRCTINAIHRPAALSPRRTPFNANLADYQIPVNADVPTL